MKKSKVPEPAPEAPRDPSESQLDEIVAEFIERHDRGDEPREQDYFTRYPDLAGALKLRFTMFRNYRAAVSPLPRRGQNMTSTTLPDRIGHFRVESELGRGAMAIVYKAHDEDTKREVAIKVLPRLFALDPKSAARFRREFDTIARLSHPNIVPVLFTGDEGGALYYAMEYIAGRTLRNYLQDLASRPVTGLTGATLGGTASRSYVETVLR